MSTELDVPRVRRRATELARLASSLGTPGPVDLALPGRSRLVSTAVADLVRAEQRTTAATVTAVRALADELGDVVEATLAADRAGGVVR